MEASLPAAHPSAAARRTDGDLRPVDRATRVLQVLLVATIVESFIHYTDNTLRYDDYTASDPSLVGSLVTRWMIPISWVLFTATAFLGYRRFRQGHWSQAAVWIGVYSVSGLVSVLHYVDISLSDLSAFQNTFVFLDVILGALILAFAIWIAVRPPDLSQSPESSSSPTGRDVPTRR